MPALAAALPPFLVETAVDLVRPETAAEAVAKPQRVGATTLETGAVSRRKGGRLIEKEQLGVTGAPDRAASSLEFAATGDSGAARPAPGAERAVVAVQAPAAIAHERPPLGRHAKLAEGIYAVGQGAGGAHRAWAASRGADKGLACVEAAVTVSGLGAPATERLSRP